MASAAEKVRGSIVLSTFMVLFTISCLLFYVHYSPIATTRFYNFTMNADVQHSAYLLEKPSTLVHHGETLSFSILNRFAKKSKSKKQNTILLFSPWSRHFGHKHEKVIARKYNTQLLHFDLPGFGHASNYSPDAVISTLKKLQIENLSIIGQGMGSRLALEVSRLVENDSELTLNHIVLFSPWSSPEYNEDWDKLASGHKLLTRLFQRIPLISEYLIKIISQFGFITRSEYWYSNLARFVSDNDLKQLKDPEWYPVINNTFIEVFRQGVGPFINLYTQSITPYEIPTDIKAPIHIYHANNDITVPVTHAHRIQRILPHAELETTNLVDHFTVFNDKFETSISDIIGIKESNERPQVFIIGGGLAGLSAAIESESHGAKVTLLEKEARVNGNSAKASSGINGALTKAQLEANISDSYELFYNDTMASGKGAAVSNLVSALVHDSTDAISFFEKRNINMDVLSMLGGHSVPRTHRPKIESGTRPRNAGADIMTNLLESIKNNKNIRIITTAKATKLIQEENNIVGVEYKHIDTMETLTDGTVVLATGGYSADRSGYLKQYFEKRSHVPTSNGPFATGDGIRMGQEVGAALKHMKYVQIHPTCYLNPKDLKASSGSLILAAEALRGYGALLVNSNGARFCNEIGLRDDTSEAIFKHCTPAVEGGPVRAFMILNDKIVDDFGRSLFAFYEKVQKLVYRYENFDELISKESIPKKKLKRTIEMYNSYADAGKDPFKKSSFPTKFEWDKPVYIAYITPCIHYTMGGLSFSPNTNVLNSKGKPIEGLFAAGEVTGGVHGKNRLGGNSLLECVVFGRRAGRNSVESQYIDHDSF